MGVYVVVEGRRRELVEDQSVSRCLPHEFRVRAFLAWR
jgi:hypothetical protein